MEKEEMMEKLRMISKKLEGVSVHTYFSQFLPNHYEFIPPYRSNNKKVIIEKLEERNLELVKELRSSFGRIGRLNSDICFLNNLLFSVLGDIKELIGEPEEKRDVYTIQTAEGTEIRIRFPELLAPVLEGYQLVKSDEGAYSFEKVDK
ncbi:MAG: hypothetical protein EOM67_08755 [Spirochaetia bacterium]|nr:hypothetical protein [Spirochaetia bacterium]